MKILKLTNTILKESNLKTSAIARKSGVSPALLNYWQREQPTDALLSNVNAVLNACGYTLAIVRKYEDEQC